MTRRVLVTGASRGIGRAVAKELAGAGFEVAINYRANAEAAAETLASIEEAGGAAYPLPFDVSDRELVRATLEAEVEERGAFWGVVLNAGVNRDGKFATLTDEDWDLVVRTNLGGFFNVVQPLIMPMIQLRDGGRIVSLSSVAGALRRAAPNVPMVLLERDRHDGETLPPMASVAGVHAVLRSPITRERLRQSIIRAIDRSMSAA